MTRALNKYESPPKLKVRLKILGDSTPIFDTFRQNESEPDSDPRYQGEKNIKTVENRYKENDL